MTKHPKLFYTLEKSLNRLNLSETQQPSTLNEWQEFINNINNNFHDFEQEQYLLERSMEISSAEMIELNQQLEKAQEIAHMGYWDYQPKENRIQFSKEAYRIFGLDMTQAVPPLEIMMKGIYIDDALILTKLIGEAITQGKPYEKEFRILNKSDNEMHWLYVEGHPYIKKTKTVNNLPPEYCIAGIIIDITKRKHAELSETLRHQITRILTEKISFIETAPELIKIICGTLKFDIGAFWTVDKSSEFLYCSTTWASNSEEMKPFINESKTSTFPPGIGLPGRVWIKKELCYIKDVVNDENFPRSAAAKKVNLHSAFAFPIIFEDEVLGVLEFFTHHIFILDDDTINLLNDLNKQIGLFIAREQAYMQMTTLSRQAGMSEIATSVLHNVGNILTSVNTSVSLIKELSSDSQIKNLVRACKLLTTNLAENPQYLVNDDKGKLLPNYLTDLSESLTTNTAKIKKESNRLLVHIEHIKDIVNMQKDISGISGISQKVLLPQVTDLAIQMSCVSLYGLEIIKNYEYASVISIDKAKLLQILVNLIRNADDALQSISNTRPKVITITIQKLNDSIEISVQDNGMGIPKNSLKRIFSMGYTTKAGGHGFGLHSSALAAHELGGRLAVDSAGRDKGATFTLILPENTGETV